MDEAEVGRRQLDAMINGYRQSAMLGAFAQLGLADTLAAGPVTCADLAEKRKVHEPSLFRLLRALDLLGIVTEAPARTFALTPLGRLLCADAPGGFRDQALLASADFMQAWSGLADGVRSGKTPYESVYGTTPWHRRESMPELNAAFNRWLSARMGPACHEIAHAYDFSHAGIIADIGGGEGTLLAAVLSGHPRASGILFEQPHVIDQARKQRAHEHHRDRLQFVSGDFFSTIHVQADIYVLKSILHDWNDEAALTILENCRRAMKPGNVLLVIERFLPVRTSDSPPIIMLDLHMMVVTGGRERSEDEFRALFQQSSLSLRRTFHTPANMRIMEAVPV